MKVAHEQSDLTGKARVRNCGPEPRSLTPRLPQMVTVYKASVLLSFSYPTCSIDVLKSWVLARTTYVVSWKLGDVEDGKLPTPGTQKWYPDVDYISKIIVDTSRGTSSLYGRLFVQAFEDNVPSAAPRTTFFTLLVCP